MLGVIETSRDIRIPLDTSVSDPDALPSLKIIFSEAAVHNIFTAMEITLAHAKQGFLEGPSGKTVTFFTKGKATTDEQGIQDCEDKPHAIAQCVLIRNAESAEYDVVRIMAINNCAGGQTVTLWRDMSLTNERGINTVTRQRIVIEQNAAGQRRIEEATNRSIHSLINLEGKTIEINTSDDPKTDVDILGLTNSILSVFQLARRV
jgi:hypothetical protein